MGVPSFYRWLVGKYPKIVANAVEEERDSIDSSLPNPNGIEFDNLYLDMNGIIHPCFHPEDQLFPPTTYDEVFIAIFEYIDRIFRIVRPRKLLYMAIDGVAPRAKLNQQRSRRFQTAKNVEILDVEEERLRKEFERAGKKVLPKEEYEVSDSNVITPGTMFMHRLSKALEYYIRLRLNSDPGWKEVQVILSDSNVPGEGEHKVMSYIRLQRSQDGYNPNTHHCIYGLDADLIMLALATHEIHFSILREDISKQDTVIEPILCRKEINMVKSREWFGRVPTGKGGYKKKPYQFLNVWTLREYLALDMWIPDPLCEFDIERIVDDFIFIAFLTGNDFLPHIPSLEIHEGAIDLLIAVYKKIFKQMGGYLVDSSKMKKKKAAFLKIKRVEQFISEIGSYEDKIFVKRYQIQQKRLKRWSREKLQEANIENEFDNQCESIPDAFSKHCSALTDLDTVASTSVEADINRNTMELKQKLKDLLRAKQDIFKNGVFENDKIQKYMEGLCWVLQYYFVGVCSWSWYYPFHYGPFASDLKGLSRTNINFNVGFPLKPFDQLMAVLPPRSSNALPKAYRHLMTSETSLIRNFYPTDFLVDMDGKRFAWQGTVKLPFIEERLILEATKVQERDLEIDEAERNQSKDDKIFVRETEILGSEIRSMYTLAKDSKHISEKTEKKYAIDGARCKINGYLTPCDDHTNNYYVSPIEGMENITEDHAIYAILKNPDHRDNTLRLLANVEEPEKTITEADIVERILWYESEGPYPQTIIRQQRYVPREEGASKGSSVPPPREMYKGAGSGWGGRGPEPVGLPCTSQDNVCFDESNGCGVERVRGSLEILNFSHHTDIYSGNYTINGSQGGRGRAHCLNSSSAGRWGGNHVSNGNRGGRGYADNRAYHTRTSDIQQCQSEVLANRGRGRAIGSGTAVANNRRNARPSRVNQQWRAKN